MGAEVRELVLGANAPLRRGDTTAGAVVLLPVVWTTELRGASKPAWRRGAHRPR